MALHKDYGMHGVHSNVQLGKQGPYIKHNGDGTISLTGENLSSLVRVQAANATNASDLVTKAQLDQVTGGGLITGHSVALGNIDAGGDGSWTDGAVQTLENTTSIAESIDKINEALENVRNNTFVKTVDFTANVTQGGAPLSVELTLSSVGQTTRYDVNWGDGNYSNNITSVNPTHNYTSNSGSPYDVIVTARNHSGSGEGSSATKTRTDYIAIYTANPSADFALYGLASGGSQITNSDQGDTIYLDNNTTNTSGATVTYEVDWGDGSNVIAIAGDVNAGGADSNAARLSHTFNTTAETDEAFTVELTLDSHSTASPGVIPATHTEVHKVYAEHTPTFTQSANSGINESSTSGYPVTITNTTENTIGSYADFGIQYRYVWGDGQTTTVNVDSGADGDTGDTITHTYALSSSNQQNGIAQDFTGNLEVISLHDNSPFVSSNFTVHVEPDVRAIITATSASSSLKSANDNIRTLYKGTDLSGTNRAILTVDNTSHNGESYEYDFGDSSANVTVTETSNSNQLSSLALSDWNKTGLNPGGSSIQEPTTGTFRSTPGGGINGPQWKANVSMVAGNQYTLSATVTEVSGHHTNHDFSYEQLHVKYLDQFNNYQTIATLSWRGEVANNSTKSTTFTAPSNVSTQYTAIIIEQSLQGVSDFSNISLTGVTSGNVGSVSGGNITHDYSSVSAGSYTVAMRASGTPDITAQNSTDTESITVENVPSAPAGLSSKSITWSTYHNRGDVAKMCSGAVGEGLGGYSKGSDLDQNVLRRYSTTTSIQTTVASDAYNSFTGEQVSVLLDGVADGTKTFSSATGETGTTDSLVITSEGDAYNEISSTTYPQNFYQVFSARAGKNISSMNHGLHSISLSHGSTGATNNVYFLYDNLSNQSAVVDISSATLEENVAGTYRYVSGIPYYNSGSPSVKLVGATVTNLTGQAYYDTQNIFECVSGTNDEGQNNTAITSVFRSYGDIDGAVTMLDGIYPLANVGIASPYALGNVVVPITTSTVNSVESIKFRVHTLVGDSAYTSDTSEKLRVWRATPTGLDTEEFHVDNDLGFFYNDDAKRITEFSSASDTPAFSSTTNYYTDHVWAGAETIAGTAEAVVKWGTIEHNTVDYSDGYLPVGPDLNTGRSGAQYITYAFRRTTMASFTLTLSGKVSGMFIAAPGTDIDDASTLNGWLDCGVTYGGAGTPGADTSNGGNGSNGCAFTSGDRVIDGTTYSNDDFTFTLGDQNATNAYGNQILVRFKLESGDSITGLNIA